MFYPFDVLVKILTVEMLLNMAAVVFIYARIYFTNSYSVDLLKTFEGQTEAIHVPRVMVLRNENENNIFAKYKACQIYCSGVRLYMLSAFHHFKCQFFKIQPRY